MSAQDYYNPTGQQQPSYLPPPPAQSPYPPQPHSPYPPQAQTPYQQPQYAPGPAAAATAPPPYQPYPQQQQYTQQQTLQPYANAPSPYDRPSSAHSEGAAYPPVSPYDRPHSAQSSYQPQSTYAAAPDQRGTSPNPGQPQYTTAPSPGQPQYAPGAQQQHQYGPDGGPDGEKGFLATVGGGAGGAFLGSKLGGGGTMSKIMGGAAGAIAANFIESKLKKDKKHGHSSGSGSGYGNNFFGGGRGGGGLLDYFVVPYLGIRS
ncbi:hypothetical protein B0T22DRAFT_535867 [Podospora appendiculata]|uniref:Glycine zipper 2TM domain-containing protein n=1 Tax=Podospora appendiculata TaxID=314037 RepID=A0AAE0XAA9_9PEZI|nr:hypothetical protein B0T22DRAFT_535867 [Podospora appendiculata]